MEFNGYRVHITEEAHEIKQAQQEGQVMAGDYCPVCFCARDRCWRKDEEDRSCSHQDKREAVVIK